MTRTRMTRTLVAGLLLAATVPGAQGQDATPSTRPSANQSSPAPATPDSASGTGTGAQSGAAASPAGTSSANGAGQTPGAGKPQAVCFKLTGRCVEPSKAPATQDAPAAGASQASSGQGTSGKKPLNLSAPDVRSVVSGDELKEPLPTEQQITETQEAETVAVKGEAQAPDVPGGFGALWWALNHPSQAWRIVAPAE